MSIANFEIFKGTLIKVGDLATDTAIAELRLRLSRRVSNPKERLRIKEQLNALVGDLRIGTHDVILLKTSDGYQLALQRKS